MSFRYDDVLAGLRAAYDAKVDERASSTVEPWKEAERQRFLRRLRDEGRTTLVELGAGTGVHGRWFADAGLDVVCTDLSAAMVEHCRAQGLVALRQDFLHLDLPAPREAAFAMNCLLHVPLDDLPGVLGSIRRNLVPGALFFWGQYGGERAEGAREFDHYEPKRFFSSLTDDEIQLVAAAAFEIVDFHPVALPAVPDGATFHFQALTLRVGGD